MTLITLVGVTGLEPVTACSKAGALPTALHPERKNPRGKIKGVSRLPEVCVARAMYSMAEEVFTAMVLLVRFELTCFEHENLNLARLPISPQ